MLMKYVRYCSCGHGVCTYYFTESYMADELTKVRRIIYIISQFRSNIISVLKTQNVMAVHCRNRGSLSE